MAATIVDLAARGYLRFEETTSSRGRAGRRIVRGDRSAGDLMPYEAKVVECLIGRERPRYRGGSAALSSPWTARAVIYDLMEEETVRRGWFRRPLGVQRTRTTWLAVSLALAGAALLTAAMVAGGVPAGLGWPALTFLVAAVAVRIIGRRPARTAAGARALAEVNTCAEALRRRPRTGDPALFPYAIVFGETAGWEDVFEELGTLPWYAAAEGADPRETAKRIRRLDGIVEPRSWENARRGRFSFSSRPFDAGTASASNLWSSSGGGFSSGGGVGGGDGGGGGGSW